MHASHVTLVQATFDRILPISDVIADIFYRRLFDLDPTMRRLFHGDPGMQGKKLLDAVSIIIGNLNRPDRILPGIRALGRRHVAYGVRSHHYTTFGEALIWTLEHGLGDAFTTEVRRAWTAVYNLLAATMKDAAATLEPAPAH